MGILAIMSFPAASVADDYDKKTIITISEPLEASGIVLLPAKYVFKLLNPPSNGHTDQAMNERMDDLTALPLTAAASKIQPKGRTVMTHYAGHDSQPPPVRQ